MSKVVPEMEYIDFGPRAIADTFHDPGVTQEAVVKRFMDFHLHLLEARNWAYLKYEAEYPEAFAGVLTSAQSLDLCLELFEASCMAESLGKQHPAVFELHHAVLWWRLPMSYGLFYWIRYI